MLETFCLSVLGSGGVAGIFFALIRHYIERRLMEVEAREQERIKYKIEQRKADEEITHATGRVLFWLHHAIVKGEHNGELEEAFEKAGVDPKRRGETLSIEEFATLSNCINEIL